MNIAFFVTDLKFEKSQYSTYWLAISAVARGHTVYHISASDITFTKEDRLKLRVRRVKQNSNYRNSEKYFRELIGPEAIVETIDITDIDILLLRSDPALDVEGTSWVRQAALQIGWLARENGVTVLNDPQGLSLACNKIYLQYFPELVRPLSIITRNPEDIKSFAKEQGRIVVKPVTGSGGKDVFLIDQNESGNINQIIQLALKNGYVIAQEYLPEAVNGDMRLFMINGEPLCKGDKYAAFRRIRKGEDMRSNVHVGAKIARAKIDDKILEIAQVVRPRLVQDGMFLVGLDIVGDKILEINVFCPGGLRNAQRLEGVDFSKMIIEALERKDRSMSFYAERWYNINPAVL